MWTNDSAHCGQNFSPHRYVSGKRDHDIIRFLSNPRTGNNAEWSFASGALNVNGIERLVFSSAREVYIDPTGGEAVLAGCDMVLDGPVHAGNVKLNGQDMDFSYEAFTIDFNKIESAIDVMTPKT